MNSYRSAGSSCPHGLSLVLARSFPALASPWDVLERSRSC